MKASTIRVIILVLIAGLLGYYIGVNKVAFAWRSYTPHITVTGKEPPSEFSNMDFTQFWTVMDKIQSTYYDKTAIDPQKMLNGAISGMVESLDDPYTMYLPPTQNGDFKQGMAGKFTGIGAELGMQDKFIVVVAPIDGSPASKAGIKTGDIILKVNDQSVAGWTLNQAVDKIRGPQGTDVTLNVVHKGEQDAHDIKITRDEIQIKSVVSWVKKVKDIDGINKDGILKAAGYKKVAYIRLSQFGDNTNKEWLDITNKLSLDMKTDPSIKGVILDLRNNPGGYLTDAVFIASEFIRSNTPIAVQTTGTENVVRNCNPDDFKKNATVVMQEDASGEKTCLNVSRTGQLLDTPVIVLINKGSASASEIVSGALRDHGRAELVGDVSFGKGTIQQAEDLPGGAGLHITIAKWLTPNGTWVHKKGLTPDIAVSLDKNDPARDTQLERAVAELVK
jgi:carboxyl-terminal processing protease